MAIPPGGYQPHNIISCPASIKNNSDDILYTLVLRYFDECYQGTPAQWNEIEGQMWRNYNETFRDLLITWFNIICKIRGL